MWHFQVIAIIALRSSVCRALSEAIACSVDAAAAMYMVRPMPALTHVLRPPGSLETAANAINSHAAAHPEGIIAEAAVSGPFVHLTLNKRISIPAVLAHAAAERTRSRANQITNDDDGFAPILVDYSSPNIAKPFHSGHLRSTIIGNVISNLYEDAGHRVHRVNYLGDWGRQFGLLHVGVSKYGKDDLLKSAPIRHVFDVYVKINQDAASDVAVQESARAAFKALEDGSPDHVARWTTFRELSITDYERIYQRLHVSFNEYSGESRYGAAAERAVEAVKAIRMLTA